MKNGFYVIQFENNDIKVETISYCNKIIQLTNAIKIEFITESIAELIKKSTTRNVRDITFKIMFNIDRIKFNRIERMRIHYLITDLISDYLT